MSGTIICPRCRTTVAWTDEEWNAAEQCCARCSPSWITPPAVKFPYASDTNALDKRILLVEDDVGSRRSLAILLAKAGFQVVQAANGAEALRIWREVGADLVLTDMHMPEKDGIQLIREVHAEAPGTRIIAVSGGGENAPANLLGEAKFMGGVHTIVKPFSPTELLTVIRYALNRPAQ